MSKEEKSFLSAALKGMSKTEIKRYNTQRIKKALQEQSQRLALEENIHDLPLDQKLKTVSHDSGTDADTEELNLDIERERIKRQSQMIVEQARLAEQHAEQVKAENASAKLANRNAHSKNVEDMRAFTNSLVDTMREALSDDNVPSPTLIPTEHNLFEQDTLRDDAQLARLRTSREEEVAREALRVTMKKEDPETQRAVTALVDDAIAYGLKAAAENSQESNPSAPTRLTQAERIQQEAARQRAGKRAARHVDPEEKTSAHVNAGLFQKPKTITVPQAQQEKTWLSTLTGGWF